MPKAGLEPSDPSMRQHLTHFTNAYSAYNAAKSGYEERVGNKCHDDFRNDQYPVRRIYNPGPFVGMHYFHLRHVPAR
jgi:hypothetical protein